MHTAETSEVARAAESTLAERNGSDLVSIADITVVVHGLTPRCRVECCALCLYWLPDARMACVVVVVGPRAMDNLRRADDTVNDGCPPASIIQIRAQFISDSLYRLALACRS